jgi:hypothetical protein
LRSSTSLANDLSAIAGSPLASCEASFQKHAKSYFVVGMIVKRQIFPEFFYVLHREEMRSSLTAVSH